MENQDLDLIVQMVFHRLSNINKQFDIKKLGETND